ncbi:mechanosensitive ion channel family protein [Photobacterium carnosum]|uniref:mechanosensitive ion channel family protein n=1 Tax=Photobacterium carnosum TaxID=2023717 RepID=UPI001E3EC34F|nr:mechanosensitive ion channel family protein [Photobacterium carnosum]MCD9496397.1 mechanosensitive ion channel [Photobacterium carnosum]
MLVIGIWIARRIRAAVRKVTAKSSKIDNTLGNALSNIIYYLLVGTIIYAALAELGVKVPGILAAFGAIGLAVGLALKDTLRNIAAGFLLVALRPIKIGEFIQTPNVDGTVKDVGLFATVMKSSDGLTIFVPNAQIWDNRIQNLGRNKERRLSVNIGVGYDTDLEVTQALLSAMINSRPEVLHAPAEPIVLVSGFGDSVINLCIKVWLAADDWLVDCSNLRIAIKKTLDEAGVEIPHPQIGNKCGLFREFF